LSARRRFWTLAQNLLQMAQKLETSTGRTPEIGGGALPRRSSGPAIVSVESSDVESTASIGTNGSRRTSIAKPVLKQLFYDIEHSGGIQDFDKGLNQGLNILLDKGDPLIYGTRGDSTRRQLTCKVSQAVEEIASRKVSQTTVQTAGSTS
jgi:hypothetical protein